MPISKEELSSFLFTLAALSEKAYIPESPAERSALKGILKVLFLQSLDTEQKKQINELLTYLDNGQTWENRERYKTIFAEVSAILDPIFASLEDNIGLSYNPKNMIHLSEQDGFVTTFCISQEALQKLVAEQRPHPITRGPLCPKSLSPKLKEDFINVLAYQAISSDFSSPLETALTSQYQIVLSEIIAAHNLKSLQSSAAYNIHLYDIKELEILIVYFVALDMKKSTSPAVTLKPETIKSVLDFLIEKRNALMKVIRWKEACDRSIQDLMNTAAQPKIAPQSSLPNTRMHELNQILGIYCCAEKKFKVEILAPALTDWTDLCAQFKKPDVQNIIARFQRTLHQKDLQNFTTQLRSSLCLYLYQHRHYSHLQVDFFIAIYRKLLDFLEGVSYNDLINTQDNHGKELCQTFYALLSILKIQHEEICTNDEFLQTGLELTPSEKEKEQEWRDVIRSNIQTIFKGPAGEKTDIQAAYERFFTPHAVILPPAASPISSTDPLFFLTEGDGFFTDLYDALSPLLGFPDNFARGTDQNLLLDTQTRHGKIVVILDRQKNCATIPYPSSAADPHYIFVEKRQGPNQQEQYKPLFVLPAQRDRAHTIVNSLEWHAVEQEPKGGYFAIIKDENNHRTWKFRTSEEYFAAQEAGLIPVKLLITNDHHGNTMVKLSDNKSRLYPQSLKSAESSSPPVEKPKKLIIIALDCSGSMHNSFCGDQENYQVVLQCRERYLKELSTHLHEDSLVAITCFGADGEIEISDLSTLQATLASLASNQYEINHIYNSTDVWPLLTALHRILAISSVQKANITGILYTCITDGGFSQNELGYQRECDRFEQCARFGLRYNPKDPSSVFSWIKIILEAFGDKKGFKRSEVNMTYIGIGQYLKPSDAVRFGRILTLKSDKPDDMNALIQQWLQITTAPAIIQVDIQALKGIIPLGATQGCFSNPQKSGTLTFMAGGGEVTCVFPSKLIPALTRWTEAPIQYKNLATKLKSHISTFDQMMGVHLSHTSLNDSSLQTLLGLYRNLFHDIQQPRMDAVIAACSNVLTEIATLQGAKTAHNRSEPLVQERPAANNPTRPALPDPSTQYGDFQRGGGARGGGGIIGGGMRGGGGVRGHRGSGASSSGQGQSLHSVGPLMQSIANNPTGPAPFASLTWPGAPEVTSEMPLFAGGQAYGSAMPQPAWGQTYGSAMQPNAWEQTCVQSAPSIVQPASYHPCPPIMSAPFVGFRSTSSSKPDWENETLTREQRLPAICRELYIRIKNFSRIDLFFESVIRKLGYTRREIEVAFEASKLEHIPKDFQNDQEKEKILPFIERTFIDYLDALFEYKYVGEKNREEPFLTDLDMIFRHLYIAFLMKNTPEMIPKLAQSVVRWVRYEQKFSRKDFDNKIEEAAYPEFWLIDDADSAQFFCKFADIINDFIQETSQGFHNSHTRKGV